MRCSLLVIARTRRPWITTSCEYVVCPDVATCWNALARSRLKRPGVASTVLFATAVRPLVRVIVFFAPIGVPGHSGEVASGAGGNVKRSFFSAIAKLKPPPVDSCGY